MKCEVRKRVEILVESSPKMTALLLAIVAVAQTAVAQTASGSGGITAATTEVKGYFSVGCTLMYAIGAVAGVGGAVKIYNKWNNGDQDTSKVASAWFGSCIFLVVVATVLKGFFGV